ncbi:MULTISPECIES: DUF1294 domain-containing protein [unclassified Rhizobium]|uniref:DUF1294 domain-containing protein n=1 Tax=unclassified Rhizobium TaxID=2613769 RepID=UPI000714AC6B|nr:MULTISPECIES: DUF1294 domain-containing protein [unclassified Rhizobium]KQS93827.1 hypothetical protein ASG50_06875 [Rhizobium sp. Leaf386]KQT06657.1 hypothetical protein ASG42_03510 [Rhizobium sp. Leaf391]KQU05086.1 hypothetical protein ASG68_26370 [Rhizobium sp. Leaf453]
MTTALTILAILLLLNIVTFCVFWWDKQAARGGAWRIPEGRLLGLAFIGGSLGALAAQQWLRHKTRKEPFRTRLILILLFHALIAIAGTMIALWKLASAIFGG